MYVYIVLSIPLFLVVLKMGELYFHTFYENFNFINYTFIVKSERLYYNYLSLFYIIYPVIHLQLGQSPLHKAVSYNRYEVVQLLLAYGASLDIQDQVNEAQ